MAEMRDIYTVMLKASLNYILEDIEEAKLFEMVSIIAKLAEQSAHTRRERRLQEEYKAEQERHSNAFALTQRVIPPGTSSQPLSGIGAHLG